MDSLWQEIGIDIQHVCETQVPRRFQLICDKQWLQQLEREHRIGEFPVWAQLDRRAHPTGTLQHPWTRILVQNYEKQTQTRVFTLPQNTGHTQAVRNDLEFLPLTYSQAIAYVANENFNKLWAAAYKKYQKAHKQHQNTRSATSPTTSNTQTYNESLRQLIQQLWHCPLIRVNQPADKNMLLDERQGCHANLRTAIAAIETTSHISILFYPPAVVTSIYDCINYSPAVLSKNYNKCLFLIYQILQLAKSFQAAGLFLGDVRLHDFLMCDNLWLQLLPNMNSNLLIVQKSAQKQHENLTASDYLLDDALTLDLEQDEQKSCSFDLKFAYDLQQFTLREYCEMWCSGQLSNFDYLTILNNAAGRSLNNPAYHHIMPWVSDFTARNGANWRDLSKSKYRLNKGDLHLDLMFNPQTHNSQPCNVQTPHHVSDFLSEITYFVYMARRTPQHILREHVRPKWVPAEYPVSIQRLQAWTPDECIPQFYTDPMIFKSIHEDLPDLELPTWATCPEDFISKHREALESQHVSQRLHQWIDLNFGYKLAGKAAVKSKNVCLTLVDQHKQLCQRGIVQLFTQPHPPKRLTSSWFDSKPPRLKMDTNNLSKSMDNLAESKKDTVSNSSFYGISNFIELPKDYNPYALLQNYETMQSFFARTFPRQQSLSNMQQKLTQQDLLFDDSSEEHSYTNQLFAASLSPTDAAAKGQKNPSLLAPSRLQLQQKHLQSLLAERRLQELQVLGCLIVEIFMMPKLRALLMNYMSVSFEQRLQACRTVYELQPAEIPKCLRRMVGVLLEKNTQNVVVSSQGLPLPPTTTQMLEPIFANTLLPFPEQYYDTYALMRSLRAYEHCSTLLELYTHFNCDGKRCAQFSYQDRQRVLFERKIAECQVMSCCAHIGRLLEPTGFEQFNALELLLGSFIELLTAEQTSILAAWNLFDPLAQALGVSGTQQHLLLPIIKLYDAESFERGMIFVRSRPKLHAYGTGQIQFSTNSSFKSRKSVKLYHHSFLLRLIVRFGLRCFLNNFITPLIEAVGGYKEPEEGSGFHYHENLQNNTDGSNENEHIFYESPAEAELLSLTPQQELLEFNYDQPSSGTTTKVDMEMDVFSFEDDVNSDHISNSGTNENKSLNSFDSNLAEDAAHECEEEQPKVAENTFQTTKSPTIDIPRSAIERSFRLSSIDCTIGSRKSVDSFEIITQQVLEEKEKQQQLKSAKSSTDDSLQASVISKMSEAKVAQNNRISEMSAESLMWLSHRLGPVLTSCYITRNLLKMLSLCYVGQENLLPEIGSGRELRSTASYAGSLNYMTIAEARVLGDQNAARVLECLMSIAGLFGEQVILLQYFSHISELIALSKKRVSSSLEGAIISILQLFKCIIPCLTDSTIMDQLKDIILDAIILPVIDLLASTQISMPSGYLGRNVLARKLLDAIYCLAVRIGSDMSKEHLCVPVLRSFFNIFNKPYGLKAKDEEENVVAVEELRDVFGVSLAHTAYVAFLQFLGDATMKSTIENLDFILLLCHKFEQPSNSDTAAATEPTMQIPKISTDAIDCPTAKNDKLSVQEAEGGAANSFGTNIVGNRLQVNQTTTTDEESNKPTSTLAENALQQDKAVLNLVAYKFDALPNTRHLKGNWLAYWRHEVNRPEKDTHLSLKQIKLQSFVGHTNSVRAILALDNENSFISASKDKTVKLWSLRSEGDGSKLSQCQFTYTAHKKSVHALTFLESMRYVVSCDSGVHVWDPFIGRPLNMLDSPRHNPVTVVKCLPTPSPLVIAGTAECALKVLDTRSMQYVCDWKLGSGSTQSSGVTVRCLTVAPSGNWLAVGLSSGSIVMLDTRTGMIINTWRPMECDLLQLVAANDQQLISSALDHSLAVWHTHDGILHYQMRPPAEPAHYLQTIGSELVFATTGNRIGFHADLNSPRAVHSVTKLHTETFRGVLTSLAVLPLNRIFLAGNESGNIVLLC